jgi:hypothetical protein
MYDRQLKKPNAFQSNKNILLSDAATVNTKPQLEIFADDVKMFSRLYHRSACEEGLFYLQSRGISKKWRAPCGACICPLIFLPTSNQNIFANMLTDCFLRG